MLPHNPPASSWGDQKHAVICYVTLNTAPFVGVAQTVSARGGCVSTFRGRWFDSNLRQTLYFVELDVKRSLYCRCSSEEERLNTRLLPFDYSRGTFWGWLSAHNGEDVGSKPTAGIIILRLCFIVLPHNPPASSWGHQKPAVIAQVTLNLSILHPLSSAV